MILPLMPRPKTAPAAWPGLSTPLYRLWRPRHRDGNRCENLTASQPTSKPLLHSHGPTSRPDPIARNSWHIGWAKGRSPREIITGEHGIRDGKLALMETEHGPAWFVMGQNKRALRPA